MEYLPCECGSTKTYVSVAKNVCCSPCFKPLEEKIIIAPDPKASVCSNGEGWAVKVMDKTIEFFSKYEDFAFTDAEKFCRKYNNRLNEALN